jgi:hemerythrin-like metal-binding protein
MRCLGRKSIAPKALFHNLILARIKKNLVTQIIWDPHKMATGVPAVDAQHQEWINRFNQFDDAINQGKGTEVVQSTLKFFMAYVDIHFELEESVMDECQCPAAKSNRAGHEHMRNILRGFNAYVSKYGYSVCEIYGLRHQMEEWLIKHILTIDVQLRNSSV